MKRTDSPSIFFKPLICSNFSLLVRQTSIPVSMAGSSHHEHDTCLVLDYGSQYTQLIARRIREKGVYSMLLPGDVEMVRGLKKRAHLDGLF